jgi:hypothetical protein
MVPTPSMKQMVLRVGLPGSSGTFHVAQDQRHRPGRQHEVPLAHGRLSRSGRTNTGRPTVLLTPPIVRILAVGDIGQPAYPSPPHA